MSIRPSCTSHVRVPYSSINSITLLLLQNIDALLLLRCPRVELPLLLILRLDTDGPLDACCCALPMDEGE
jgi:hypothetical protein